jgi:two-component system sensor histidine kinase BarA
MDGISALKEIKKLPNNNNKTPIIAVTAHALSGEKEKMHQQGFNAYMTKPIDEAMLRHIIYEYCDFDHLVNANSFLPSSDNMQQINMAEGVVDWPLALERSAGKVELAKEMFLALVDSLPQTKQSTEEAISSRDTDKVKRLVHKLNGACCYTGTPNLAKITIQLETQLKNGLSIEELEPEFLEFFEHIDQVLNSASKALKSINTKND